jgi:conjugative transfer signal peptidase TraF
MQQAASDDIHRHVARARPWRTTRPGTRRTWSSLVLGGLVLAAVVSTRWVRLNLSPSVPRGLYWLTAVREPLARGTLVVLPVPASVQAWHARWVPLLKPVAAMAGAVVCVGEEELWVEGLWYGPVLHEAAGQPLPRIHGCVAVPDGAVFLASQAPRSLDGRYFGPTPIAALTARAIPLMTWR